MKTITTAILAIMSLQCMAQNIRPFGHIDIGVTAGSTGIGVDVFTPVSDIVRMRTGVNVMPRFSQTVNFGVDVGITDDEDVKQYYMDNIRAFMYNFTGQDIKDNIDMEARPSFVNAKLLVDVFPFKNKHWRITAGLYFGGRTIAKAVNTLADTQTLIGVRMYNELYKKGAAREPMFSMDGVRVDIPSHFLNAMLENYGEMAVNLGVFSHDIIATEDIYWDYDYYEYGTNRLIHAKGDLRCAQGDVLYYEGEAYRMKPDDANEVTAQVRVNPIRPYLGCGYEGEVGKDGKTTIGLDMGLMFWGGSPSVITHDGIDLVKDLRDVRGKVGDYVDLISSVKAFPLVEFRVSRRLW